MCRIAEREYKRQQRAAARGVAVAPMPDDDPPEKLQDSCNSEPGPCERDVSEQLAAMPAASTTHTGEAAVCLRLARLLDDQRYGTSWASAARQLRTGLTEIRDARPKGKGHLFEVASMGHRDHPEHVPLSEAQLRALYAPGRA